MASKSVFDIPFDQLPDPRRVWLGEPGSREEGLGKLSILTPELVALAAAQEIKTGRRVAINWDLNKLEYAPFDRQPCEHRIIPLFGGIAHDDIYTFNPQQSSQWDGLRHFSQPKTIVDGKRSEERVFYGGTTRDEIEDRSSGRIGTQHWAQEGIAGRGVLIDYAWWAEKNGIQYSTFSRHQVKFSDILDIAKECSITFKKGDILLVRIGMTKEWQDKWGVSEKKAYQQNTAPEHAGVETNINIIRWIWDTGFSAVAGDAISWEVWPPTDPELIQHEYLLPGWGMPVGEMFDLEGLSALCQELQRWSFFLTSMPLNMPGGVSSPPNGLAIF